MRAQPDGEGPVELSLINRRSAHGPLFAVVVVGCSHPDHHSAGTFLAIAPGAFDGENEAMAEDAVPIGLAALVVAASLVEVLRKRGVIDQEAVDSIMKTAVVYMQAFGADHPPEIEQETSRILQLVAKASGQTQLTPTE